VARVLTDHPHDTLTADDFALVADLFDAGSDLHGDFLEIPWGALSDGARCSTVTFWSSSFECLVRDSDDLAPVGVILGDLEKNLVPDE
jgi:hypothetical protein